MASMINFFNWNAIAPRKVDNYNIGIAKLKSCLPYWGMTQTCDLMTKWMVTRNNFQDPTSYALQNYVVVCMHCHERFIQYKITEYIRLSSTNVHQLCMHLLSKNISTHIGNIGLMTLAQWYHCKVLTSWV